MVKNEKNKYELNNKTLTFIETPYKIIRKFPSIEKQPDYEIIAGIVIMNLTISHLIDMDKVILMLKNKENYLNILNQKIELNKK